MSLTVETIKYAYTSYNKLNFALYCERSGISTPKLIGHNFGNDFFSAKSLQNISSAAGLVQYFNEVFDSHNVDVIFFRPLALNGGQGCFKLERTKIQQQLEEQYDNLVADDCTYTEVIPQHAEISTIYGKSINTLRILTFNDNGEVHVISSFLRLGAGGSIVDNGSIGGLFVGIHHEKGTLKQIGHRDMKFGGGEFMEHPDSGFQFENFKVPFFKEACELSKFAAKRIPDGLIGWDVAITPSGPTIIEGNEDMHLFMSDVAYGGLLKNRHMEKIISMC